MTGAVTAVMTNPIWVVKVRMFTTRADDSKSYRGLWRACFRSRHLTCSEVSLTDGFSSIYNTEGMRGLWKGTSLALVGVSNGAIQFMAYEEMKRWGFEQKRKQFARAGKTMTPEDDKLVRITRPDARSFIHLHPVEHGLYRHVRRKQVVCTRDDVPIPGHSFAPTSGTRLLVRLMCLT